MSFDPQAAGEYLAAELAAGRLTHATLARIVGEYQLMTGLVADGRPGPATLEMLDHQSVFHKVYPLAVLPDMRKPEITSQYKTRNPARPDHNGVDLFYRYDPAKDPPVKVGDGAAARGKDGKPKWWIPEDAPAIAAAPGRVSAASNSKTGWRVWIEHADGHRTGYFHLRNVRVAVGQYVEIGKPLGEVGDNPADLDAEHLHFEVSPLDRYEPMDPEMWLQGATYHHAG